MRFWPTNSDSNQPLNITDVQIQIVHVTKFLGVYLDKDLNWKYRANQLYNKLQQNKQLLNLSQNFLDICTLIKIYYAC